MAFDKAKIVRAAEKYLAQGKIPAAIKEYRQIVDNEPDDFTALNMLGDLHVRQNEKQEATQCFLRIAEHYREEGFQGKAIAMYKKIDRLNPRSPEIANKLALLYETQGLIVDARAQYMVVADAWLRDGQTRKALEIFRKVADLDPQNTEARTKLAQGYQREGLLDDAASAHAEAGAQFLIKGKYEGAIDAFMEALEMRPLDYVALSGLLDAHIALGTPDEAAEVLERALERKPEDVELLSMLARAYLDADDAASSERVVSSLVLTEASNYVRFIDVAKRYLKIDKVDDAVRVLSGITEQMLAGREEAKLMELLNEALARDPEHIEALRLLVRVYAWQREDDKQRQALERLVEATEAAGLEDVERSALMQLAQFSPDQRYLERLRDLGHSPEQYTQQRQPEPEPAAEEVPSFESFALVDDSVTPQPAARPDEVAEFEFNAVKSPNVSDPASSFADLNEDWNDAANAQQTRSFQEFEFGVDSASAPIGVSDVAAGPAGALDEKREAMLRLELDSVDFYIAQGYMDIAANTLDILEKQFGAHPDIDGRRAKVNLPEPAPGVDGTPADTVEFDSFARYDVAEEVTPIVAEPVADGEISETSPGAQQLTTPPSTNAAESAPADSKSGLDPGLQAIFDEFRTAAEEEETPADDGDYETRYNLGIAYKEMELLDEAVEEFQIAASKTAPKDGTARYLQCCNMLGHCFLEKKMPQLAVMWFRKGLEAPDHTEDEYQALRYDLGSAYEQMGDLDRAIEVFSEVYGVSISYRGVAEKLRDLQTQKAVNTES